MAVTTLDKQILEEGWRNAVVRLTGALAMGESEIRWIQLADFLNNDQRAGALVGLRVDCIQYSIGAGMQVQLEWDGATPQQIADIAGRGDIDSWFGGGLQPDRNRTGYNGAINLRTTGFPAGTVQNFTVVLRMVKLYGTPGPVSA